MKRIYIGVFLILTLSLIIYGTIHGTRVSREKKDTHEALTALSMCGHFLSEYSIDKGTPIPVTLDEIPEWEQYVARSTDPYLKAMYRKIHFSAPLNDRAEGNIIGSIELPHSRVVLEYGGAVYSINK